MMTRIIKFVYHIVYTYLLENTNCAFRKGKGIEDDNRICEHGLLNSSFICSSLMFCYSWCIPFAICHGAFYQKHAYTFSGITKEYEKCHF